MKHRAESEHDTKSGHALIALEGSLWVPDDGHREFLDMFARSQRTIIQICLHFTDRRTDSIRDLYQDIAAALWESWPRFRGASAPDTWVHRIALNVAVSQVRCHVRQPEFVPLEDWMYDTLAEEIDKAPPDYFRIIAALDPEERALILLRIKGLSISDIAQVSSSTPSAVKQHLYRIRQKIDLLKQQQNNEEQEN